MFPTIIDVSAKTGEKAIKHQSGKTPIDRFGLK